MRYKHSSLKENEANSLYFETVQRRARDDGGGSKGAARASAFSGAPVMSPIWLCNDNTPSLLSLTVICNFQDEKVGKAI